MIDSLVAAGAQLVCGPTVVWHCDPAGARQRIYFANHASHLDFIVLWTALPRTGRRNVRPVAGRDYWERSALRRYLAREVFHAILVHRNGSATSDRTASARDAVEAMAKQMGKTTSLIVFPEGTRSSDGEVQPFKSGLYHLSRAVPDAELIPVYLHNLNRILPRGESLPVPMLSRVTFGAPLPVVPDESKEAFLERVRASVVSLKENS
jgi:1-acyl-sn-glycerol-3-phosphate acyltransferase